MAAVLHPNLVRITAGMREVKDEVKTELRERAARVQAVVDLHVRTGALASHTKVEIHTVDSTVVISDPDVLAINYGHRAPNGTFVPGIHAVEAGL
ncbi:DUF5403 family protein [Streptacidiphilus sp. P02-A3a]|uniref:DUF5403 family protein n=1 Tax=Streptacidiphilus sp. P02-A3a TaxID=2704468 RepID=UPI0015F8E538|nr:DUF5403 family protein [Streptacidiphilus sp. P02-A3a]QMU72141.1 hypothetical protein GXP74_31780 [Streptacidiphilus sp. P02-A3a]